MSVSLMDSETSNRRSIHKRDACATVRPCRLDRRGRNRDKAVKVKTLFAITLLAATGLAGAVEKKIWAESFLGRKAPDVVVEEWVSKKPSTTGKWVLVDFWATWCGPCIEGIPHLNEFHKEFGSKLVVIGISQEKRSSVERMKKPVIDYFHGVSPAMQTYKAFGVKGIPHVVVIDPKGVVRWEGFPLLPGFKLTREVLAGLIGG